MATSYTDADTSCEVLVACILFWSTIGYTVQLANTLSI